MMRGMQHRLSLIDTVILRHDSGGLGCSLLGLRQERMKAPAPFTTPLLI